MEVLEWNYGSMRYRIMEVWGNGFGIIDVWGNGSTIYECQL